MGKGCSVWGLGHLLESRLYFTKGIVDHFSKNRQPTPISRPPAQVTSKPAPKREQVQLFKMRHKVGKRFYSTAMDTSDSK